MENSILSLARAFAVVAGVAIVSVLVFVAFRTAAPTPHVVEPVAAPKPPVTSSVVARLPHIDARPGVKVIFGAPPAFQAPPDAPAPTTAPPRPPAAQRSPAPDPRIAAVPRPTLRPSRVVSTVREMPAGATLPPPGAAEASAAAERVTRVTASAVDDSPEPVVEEPPVVRPTIAPIPPQPPAHVAPVAPSARIAAALPGQRSKKK